MSHVLGLGGSHSNRASSINTGTSPLQDREMLDQVIHALLDYQSQQNPATQETTLNRFRQLSRSLRQSSRRSSGRLSTRSSFQRTPRSVHSQHENQGE